MYSHGHIETKWTFHKLKSLFKTCHYSTDSMLALHTKPTSKITSFLLYRSCFFFLFHLPSPNRKILRRLEFMRFTFSTTAMNNSFVLVEYICAANLGCVEQFFSLVSYGFHSLFPILILLYDDWQCFRCIYFLSGLTYPISRMDYYHVGGVKKCWTWFWNLLRGLHTNFQSSWIHIIQHSFRLFVPSSVQTPQRNTMKTVVVSVHTLPL